MATALTAAATRPRPATSSGRPGATRRSDRGVARQGLHRAGDRPNHEAMGDLSLPRVSLLALVASFLASGAGCLYDPEDRCGDRQHLDDGDTCVCDAGAIAVDGRCQPCPDGEIVAGAVCACAPGTVRDPATKACVVPPTGQGAACAAATPCETAEDPRCTADGYCSRDCSVSADCVGGYACDLAAEVPYCVRPPSGQQQPCASNADCAGLEASYCETTVGHVCLVPGCAVGGDDCFIGWSCCDLTGFLGTTLCLPEGQCPS